MSQSQKQGYRVPALHIPNELSAEDLSDCLHRMADLGIIDVEIANKIFLEVSVTRGLALKAIESVLTPEQKKNLFANLRTNFQTNMILHRGIEWEQVQQKLEKSEAAIISLNQMWARGGEPTVTDFNAQTGEYRFDDCSAESPLSGRNTTYAQAEKMAQEMGVNLMEPGYYKYKFQKLGKQFDRNSWNWLKSSQEALQEGIASHGFRDLHTVRIYEDDANLQFAYLGFRTSLWV